MRILKSPQVSQDKASRAVELISKTPAEIECKEVANKYLQEAKEHLSSVRDSKYTASLSDLADRVVSRSF